MPEKPLSIATYAAGASLAAITLVYVFGPTFFLDDDAANSSRSSRKRSVVGLVNLANDCFINSVLQALAGLPELRLYLIREIHQRRLGGPNSYSDIQPALDEQDRVLKKADEGKTGNGGAGTKLPAWKLLGLQQGLVTQGLKQVLDALNERPIYKKTISAQGFIRCVEDAFRTRISRQQQDAQEFLQIVTERLCDEWKAGLVVRKGLANRKTSDLGTESEGGESISEQAAVDGVEAAISSEKQARFPNQSKDMTSAAQVTTANDQIEDTTAEPTDFPFEGKLESEVECTHCGFVPNPSVSTFTTLTLHVPHDQGSSTLNDCFDEMFKVEHIDDFKCDKCRLVHALDTYNRQLSRLANPTKTPERAELEANILKLSQAIDTDPENPPKGVKLPDTSSAPRRRIQRHSRISRFPRILAVHLSRSMWSAYSVSTKNLAKVSFPETLSLGGLLDRKNYRLLCVVTHKGGHNSGHYESFRRQVLKEPFSTSATLGTGGIYSRHETPVSSPRTSMAPSPRLSAGTRPSDVVDDNKKSHTTDKTGSDSSMPISSDPSSRSSANSAADHQSIPIRRHPHPTTVPFDAMPTPGLPTPPENSNVNIPAAGNKANGRGKRPSSSVSIGMNKLSGPGSSSGKGRRWSYRKGDDRWWRISDDSIKEAKTADVLKMQREVYLLFYEIVD